MEVVVVVVVDVVAGIGIGTGEVLEAPEVCTLWGGVGASAAAASTWLFVWCLVSGLVSGLVFRKLARVNPFFPLGVL